MFPSQNQHNQLLTLAKQYLAKADIPASVTLKETSHGSSNQIYQVEARDQSYFLKLAPLDDVGQKHENSRRALNILKRCGIKAPEYLAGDIDSENNFSWFIQSGISGEDLLTKLKTFQFCPNQVFEHLASATALLHLKSSISLSPSYSPQAVGRYLDREQERYLIAGIGKFRQELLPLEKTIGLAFEQVRAVDFYCLNHGDIKPDNCIDHLGEPVLVDWDSARVGIPEFDLGTFCLLHRNSSGAIDYFLKSYQEYNDIDQQALQSSIVIGALRQYLLKSSSPKPAERLPFLEIIRTEGESCLAL